MGMRECVSVRVRRLDTYQTKASVKDDYSKPKKKRFLSLSEWPARTAAGQLHPQRGRPWLVGSSHVVNPKESPFHNAVPLDSHRTSLYTCTRRLLWW